ncbi:hypothetical protein GCM10017783_26320 [Deinococcus piscis]|uniref:Uncharacterized protein n=1 Tax=Deinococcus piscis TaxID=394230 RepID=A0ABQ3KDR3_9DEIO|nr:hypothetical protein GCM10017783_26320 [Deinococcus piscis]
MNWMPLKEEARAQSQVLCIATLPGHSQALISQATIKRQVARVEWGSPKDLGNPQTTHSHL